MSEGTSSHLLDADRRVIAVACNALLDRAFGKPKEPPVQPGHEAEPVEARMAWDAFSTEELAAIEAFALAAQKRHELEQKRIDSPAAEDAELGVRAARHKMLCSASAKMNVADNLSTTSRDQRNRGPARAFSML